MATNTETETVTTATARRVRDAIDAQERSHRWVADKVGIPYATFGRKVRGHKDFTVSELARIARVLGVPAAALVPADFHSEACDAACGEGAQ